MPTRPLLRLLCAIIFLSAVLLSGCSVLKAFSDQNTLTVLAGSELKDMEPLLEQIRRETGIKLEMQYTGTLDGAEKLLAGADVDLAWFSHAKYLNVLEGAKGRVKAQEKIMLSPVILGVKTSKAQEWGWVDNPDVTWEDIVEQAASGELRFAMTNPTSSNTGFSALVGAAAALSGSADALQVEDVDRVSKELKTFFKGLALTSGSSGWLAERYLVEQDRLDGIINYESVLLGLNENPGLREQFTLIYPKEGIITADYPLMLINDEQREAYDKLVSVLRQPEFQRKIMESTLRRPVVPEVPVSSQFSNQLLVEVPFPNNQEVVDHLLFAYLDEQSRPAHTFFILDVSGSMKGERLSQLKQAMNNLTGADTSLTGQFARFRDRERITMLPFSGQVQDVRDFEVDLNDANSLSQVQEFVDSLDAGGSTAIYSTLEEVYRLAWQAQKQDPERYYSIVLLSDGANTAGNSQEEFLSFYNQASTNNQPIKTFAILFGEADEDTMQTIAGATGGRVFDAKSEALNQIFKEIRGYQ
jgi:Ca-activated chloride channel family protein